MAQRYFVHQVKQYQRIKRTRPDCWRSVCYRHQNGSLGILPCLLLSASGGGKQCQLPSLRPTRTSPVHCSSTHCSPLVARSGDHEGYYDRGNCHESSSSDPQLYTGSRISFEPGEG